MSTNTYHEVDVPEGYRPMTQPTRDENRLERSKIQISLAEEQDLRQLVGLADMLENHVSRFDLLIIHPTKAAIHYAAFPDAFWEKVEDSSACPSLEKRIDLLAKHFAPLCRTPGYHFIKATHADTGVIMGTAIWMENGRYPIFPTTYPGLDDIDFPPAFVPGSYRDDLVRSLAFDRSMGWSDADMSQLYAHHKPAWYEQFRDHDVGRVKEMGDRPHWYLAPLCVDKPYQAMGVGKALTMYGLEKADAGTPPAPCVLDALPNARPAYYHLGFEPTADHGPHKDAQLVRSPLGGMTDHQS
ncbi:MAG: hypothetical protein Q9162_003042 [Coniocarpon cinnabarinum]